MGDPLSAIASAASIARLAEVSCRLASSLFKSFQAIKEAPQSIRRLSNELQQLHCLLQEIDNLVKRHNSSQFENGPSITTVQSLLQDCKTELDEVVETTAPFRTDSSLLEDAVKRIRWVARMPKIERHCQAVDALGRCLGVALSVFGRQHDITNSEAQRVLHNRMTEIRDTFQASLTEARNQVSTELLAIRTGMEHVASKVIPVQHETNASQRTRHDSLRGDVLQTGNRSAHGLDVIRNDIRDVSVLSREIQRQNTQHQRELYRSINYIESMLSKLSIIRLEPQSNRPQSVLAQQSCFDSIMLSLMLMRSSLYNAISHLKSAVSAKISKDAGKFLLDEYEKMVAFVREASDLHNRQSFNRFDNDGKRLPQFTMHPTTLRNYFLNAGDFPFPNMTSEKQWRNLSHFSALGRLEVRFEEKTEVRNFMPISIVIASFHFTPNLNVHSTAVFALFRREMQIASKPSITRNLREIRQIARDDDQVGRPLVTALVDDDLPYIQRMLSSGQIRPWDQDWGGRNLLKMAAWIGGSGKILEYLIKIVRLSVDCPMVQWWVLANFAVQQLNAPCEVPNRPRMRGDFQSYIELCRRAINIKQALDDGFVINISSEDNDCMQLLYLDRRITFGIHDCLSGDGAEIECKDRWGETPLLEVARSNFEDSPNWTWALLQCGADILAVDCKERGPLHLSLRYSRGSCYKQDSISWVDLQAKLVHLLRAGCQIHAVDNRGHSPTDYARGLNLKNVWVSALREVNMLNGDILESLYNESECSIIDSDSDSCCSSDYEEEQHVEYEKEEEENDKRKAHNQHQDNVDDDRSKRNEEPMDQDMLMIEDNVSFLKEENHDAKRNTRHTLTSKPDPHSFLGADVSLANAEMQDDSLIATGQHHIWIL